MVALQDYDNHKDLEGIHNNYRMLEYKDSDLFRWTMKFLCEVDCEGFTDKYNVLKPWLNQVMFKIVFKDWDKVKLRGIGGKKDVPAFEDYEGFKEWNEWAVQSMYDVVLAKQARARDGEESDDDESGEEKKNEDESEENHNELRTGIPCKPLFDDDVSHKKRFDQYQKDIASRNGNRANRNRNGKGNGGTRATLKTKRTKEKKRKRADDENDDSNDGPEPKRRRIDDIINQSDHSDHPLNDTLKKLHGSSPPPYNEDIFTKSGCNNKISLKEIIKQAKEDAKDAYDENHEINDKEEADDDDDDDEAKSIV